MARLLPLSLVLLAAAGAYALTTGARQSMGLFLGPLNTATGLGLASISLAFAVGQLWWGLTQPIAGLVADRFGAGRVLLVGIGMLALGTALIPFMTTTAGLIFAAGVLAAGGAGLAGPAVLMSATARLVAPEKRGMATGIVNAGSSFGQFVCAPLAQAISSAAGWVVAVQSLAVLTLLALPAAWVLRGNAKAFAAAQPGVKQSAGQALKSALTDRNYLLLSAGFFTCGFHVAFLATHLPGVVASCQLSPDVGAWALAVLGLFNIAGSLGIGWAISHRGGWWRLKSMLALLYAARAVAVLVFVLAPKTPTVMLVFAAVMGLTYLSTVPATAGMVVKLYGPANMATLFGVVMLVHQMGSFLGVYLGGVLFQSTGSYDLYWAIDIALAVGAALVNLPIREATPAGRAAVAA